MPGSNVKFEGTSLGNWLKNQRENKAKLTEEQLKKLMSVNFDLTALSRDEVWNQEYFEKTGTIEVPALFAYKGVKLGMWIVQQRQKKLKLNSTQIAKLDSLNFNWAPRENEWDNSFIEYKN